MNHKLSIEGQSFNEAIINNPSIFEELETIFKEIKTNKPDNSNVEDDNKIDIKSIRQLKRFIITRKKEIICYINNLCIPNCKLDDKMSNEQFINNFIQFINIRFNINFYDYISKLYQDETKSKYANVIDGLYNNRVSPKNIRKSSTKNTQKSNDEENIESSQDISIDNFNELVSQGKISISTYKIILFLINSDQGTVNLNNLYLLCQVPNFEKIYSKNNNHSKLIQFINIEDIAKLKILVEKNGNSNYLATFINTTNLDIIKLIDDANKLSFLIKNLSFVNLSILLNSAEYPFICKLINNVNDSSKSNDFFNKINPEKLLSIIGNSTLEFISDYINNNYLIANLSYLINELDGFIFSNLIVCKESSKFINEVNRIKIVSLIQQNDHDIIFKLLNECDSEDIISLIDLCEVEKLTKIITKTRWDNLVTLINNSTRIYELANCVNDIYTVDTFTQLINNCKITNNLIILIECINRNMVIELINGVPYFTLLYILDSEYFTKNKIDFCNLINNEMHIIIHQLKNPNISERKIDKIIGAKKGLFS